MTLRAQAADVAIDLCRRRCAATFVTLVRFFTKECGVHNDVVANQHRGGLVVKAKINSKTIPHLLLHL